MSKFKKALIALLVAAGVSCLAGVAACNGGNGNGSSDNGSNNSETTDNGNGGNNGSTGGNSGNGSGNTDSENATPPAYYKLSLQGSGVDFILKDKLEGFISGGTVKEGVEVKFSVAVGSSTEGTPTVYLNGEELTCDENGNYSFIMDKDSTVTTAGVGVMYNLTFNKKERVQNEDGEYVEEERRIAYLDVDGKELTDTKVREGSGFSFKLKKSVYYTDEFTVLSNYDELTPDSNGVYTIENVTANTTVNVVGLTQAESFATRPDCGRGTKAEPYLLSEPIDLYYLAALTNSDFYAGSHFYSAYYELAGDIDFDGEQMFVIGDNSIETAVFCGEFDGKGYTVKNFYLTDEVVDQETYENEYLQHVGFFGFVAAQNSKPAVIKNVNIEGASLSLHTAAAKQQGQSGGLLVGYGIGVHISGCSVNGEIVADSDNTYYSYTGGVAGILQSAYNENVEPVLTYDSYIADCESSVNISATGGVYCAGGIVGYLISADSSAISYVKSCSSSGNVYGSIHAGGIAGRVGLFSSVVNSSSTGNVRAVNTMLDNSINDAKYYYAYAGGIAGYAENDTVIAYCGAQGSVAATAASGAQFALKESILGSSSPDGESAVNSRRAVVIEGEIVEEVPEEVTINGVSHGVAPIVNWYAEGALDEFVTGAQGRSWGYFFDEELTKKVPVGFVPVKNVTLYCGYVDYTAVAGEFILESDRTSARGKLTLTADGKAYFRQGALSHVCDYTYDGETITIINGAFAALDFSDDQLNGAHFSFVCAFEGRYPVFHGKVDLASASGSSATTEEVSYTASSLLNGFSYGKYSGGGAYFVISRDGTAEYVRGNSTVSFNYTMFAGKIYLSNSAGDNLAGTVSGNQLTEINGVALTYEGEVEEADDTFAGVWFLPGMREKIELTFASTAETGGEYGSAEIYYAGGKIVELDGAQYDVQVEGNMKYVSVYVNDRLYALLTYDGATDTLSGTCYSMHYSTFLNSKFYRYDALSGSWNTDGGEYSKITFNGKGRYDETGKPATESSQELMEVHGSFTAATAGNVTVRGSYSLDSATAGVATIGDKRYTIVISDNTVTLTNEKDSGDIITLTK